MTEVVPKDHKAGFVNIIGQPNAGKSTLMNRIIGEKMSIITHKPQTTRHRIKGIIDMPQYQIVFSDTPGLVSDPAYEMHRKMNQFIELSLEDADVLLFIIDPKGDVETDLLLLEKIKRGKAPVFLLINKVDLLSEKETTNAIEKWKERYNFKEVMAISALHGLEVGSLIEKIAHLIPESPPFYPKGQFTDLPERFFVSEMVREQILLQYREEIPYSVEVQVDSFERQVEIIHIHITIFVNRQTQKSILIGKNGSAIKNLGIAARKRIEEFLESKVFLKLFVKVRKGWRDNERELRIFGYH